MPRKILLLSPYDAESHKRWRESVVRQFPDVAWTQLVLAPRYFSWRIRGNSMIWAVSEKETLNQKFDLILATSMVDLSSLIGMAPSLVNVPSILYFHENQYAYPQNADQNKSIEPLMVTLYSALSATYLKFNSQYNLESFLSGVDRLLKRFPDHVPEGIVDDLRAKSAVLPVAIEDECFTSEVKLRESHFRSNDVTGNHRWEYEQDDASSKPCIRIVWNARWEYDKSPEKLVGILRELESRGVAYRIAILGQRFRQAPEEFALIEKHYSHRLAQFGFVENVNEYRGWLASADIVLATAIHEFQGLAVLEAIALGCIPVLPSRQVYPEIVPQDYLYEHHESDPKAEAKSAVDLMLLLAESNAAVPNVERFSWNKLKIDYEEMIGETVSL